MSKKPQKSRVPLSCHFSLRQVISTRTGISFFTGIAKSDGGSILKSVTVVGIVPDIRISSPNLGSPVGMGPVYSWRSVLFGQTRAHTNDRKLPAARYLKRVKIAVAVAGIEGLNRYRDQEIALSGVANALPFRRMADAFNLMQRVRHMIGEGGLFESPLTICLSKGWKRKEQKGC